ncbi:MAG TPA: DUF4388 domain-containing protein [Vicinamibacteria bacterium]|nr:DUF4388 domain-containing protein [Vicinamibacteria bacterium]
MAFQGSLAELHLPDIIQLVSVSGKTGVFHLQDGALRGQIFLNDGKIIHAEIDETVGEEAVYALAIWRQGDFRFEPGVDTEARTITKSNTNLLMEAARRLDEWRVLSKKIPSTDLLPEFVVQENREGQINLNTSEWLILSKIDGNRSVKAIAAASGLSVFDAAKMLYGLIATGLIRLKEPVAAAAPTPAAGARGTAARPAPATGGTPTPQGGAARPAPTSAPAGAELLAKLNRVRDASSALLGPGGETVINKHYLKAKGEIERGSGFEAVEEAANQIARAAAILKGPSAAETLLEQIRSLK